MTANAWVVDGVKVHKQQHQPKKCLLLQELLWNLGFSEIKKPSPTVTNSSTWNSTTNKRYISCSWSVTSLSRALHPLVRNLRTSGNSSSKLQQHPAAAFCSFLPFCFHGKCPENFSCTFCPSCNCTKPIHVITFCPHYTWSQSLHMFSAKWVSGKLLYVRSCSLYWSKHCH